MKNLILTLILIFSISKNGISQLIDAIEFTPLEVNLFFASNTFLDKNSSSEKTWMISYSGDVKLSKSISENIDFQLGLRYQSMRYNLNFWSGSIEAFFFDIRDEVIVVPMGMEDLVLRRVKFTDKFLTIPIGGKYFLSDPREDISGYFSAFYQPSFLIADDGDSELAIKGGFIFPTYTPVMNSEFEPLVDEYFATRKSFFSSFQFGFGGTVKLSETTLMGGELQWNWISDSLHDSILYKQNGLGGKLFFTYFFQKKNK